MIELSKQTLLIVAPHPDDEVLGCGGLIKKIKDAGGKVYVLFLTVGETNDYSEKGVSKAEERIEEIEAVAKYYKYNDYHIAFKGDTYHLKLDQVPQKDIMSEIENGKISLNKIKPTIVATTPYYDYNQDHRAATDAVFAAARPAPDETKPFQPLILGYESVPTSEWATQNHSFNFLVPLTDEELEAKVHGLKLYKTQVRTGSHPRSVQSVKTMAHFRGIYCGTKQAEAYVCYRFTV
jgi:N-acetylglucosamine malate deacetylase 1